MPIDIKVSPATQADLRRLSRDLRRHGDGKAIRRESIRRLREGVKPVELDIKAAARRLPARGTSGSTGLRAQIARATGTQVKLSGRSPGVRVRVSKKRMGGERIVTIQGRTRLVGDQRNLPQRMNRGQWRHPLFGNRDVWVVQKFSRPRWFDNINRAARPTVRRRVKKVLDDIERKLAN